MQQSSMLEQKVVYHNLILSNVLELKRYML